MEKNGTFYHVEKPLLFSMVRDRDCKFLSWRIFDEIVEIFSVEGTDRENEFFHIFAVDFVC